MNSTPAVPVDESPSLETSATARRVIFRAGLLVIWLFVAGFWQFALVDRLAPPAAERTNNGERATFFAVHINPYYVFSEDFHLYVVRAKRIMERGWTDSPLCSTPYEKPNYSAPLQAALMMLAVQTDGRPVPYSLFICGVLAVAWTTLYVAAARWLPRSVSPLTPIIAVLIAVLFESIEGLRHMSGEFNQWPVHRGLRMSTLAWTSPLALSVLLASVSLLFQRERPTGRVLFVAVVLSALAAADPWAFSLTTACVGSVVGLFALTTLLGRNTLAGGVRPLLASALGLCIAAAIALAIHQATTSGLEGDTFTRAGFGPAWRDSPLGATGSRRIVRDGRSRIGLIAALGMAASTYVALRLLPSQRQLQVKLSLSWPTTGRLQLFTLAAVPLAATTAILGALAELGMDEYHAFQFEWRCQYMFLFAVIVVASECSKHGLRTLIREKRRSNLLEIALTASLLAAFFVYHNARIYQFVSKTAAHDFFLTRDEEALREWLEKREPSLGKFSLATASHELNYLCAYWTNADLLLPEGFPYHGAASNDEIESQTARLLAVYQTTPQSWLDFHLYLHGWDQWSWGRSRLLSARHGYMYYLLHRVIRLKGNDAVSAKSTHPRGTTAHLADRYLEKDQNVCEGRFNVHRAEVESAQRIATKLDDERQKTSVHPDVIIVDEVSRALGTPDFTGYTREFHHGTLEGWVRTERLARRQ